MEGGMKRRTSPGERANASEQERMQMRRAKERGDTSHLGTSSTTGALTRGKPRKKVQAMRERS
jgi:hypothetical protein